MNLNIDISKEEVTSFYSRIGKNVKEARQQKGLSQLQLALAMGFGTVSNVAKAETMIESKHFNLGHLYKIAKILEVDLCTLLKQDDDKNG